MDTVGRSSRSPRRGRRLRRLVQLALAVVAAGMLVASAPTLGQVPDASREAEYRIKAAFLYRFLQFVEWPEPAREPAGHPLVIGVIDGGDFGSILKETVADRVVMGRSILVRQLGANDSLADLQVLFIGREGAERSVRILNAVKGLPLLTVTESGEAFAAGSVINFVVVDGKVRFDVAMAPAEHGGLKISARLLAVARHVAPADS